MGEIVRPGSPSPPLYVWKSFASGRRRWFHELKPRGIARPWVAPTYTSRTGLTAPMLVVGELCQRWRSGVLQAKIPQEGHHTWQVWAPTGKHCFVQL
eukprot:6123358-Prymnesium_polylepis.3